MRQNRSQDQHRCQRIPSVLRHPFEIQTCVYNPACPAHVPLGHFAIRGCGGFCLGAGLWLLPSDHGCLPNIQQQMVQGCFSIRDVKSRRMWSELHLRQLAYIAQALDVLGELRGKDRGPLLWSDMTEASELLEELCQRTEEARSCWSVPAWSLKSQIHIHPFDSFFNCKERCDFFTACCAS